MIIVFPSFTCAVAYTIERIRWPWIRILGLCSLVALSLGYLPFAHEVMGRIDYRGVTTAIRNHWGHENPRPIVVTAPGYSDAAARHYLPEYPRLLSGSVCTSSEMPGGKIIWLWHTFELPDEKAIRSCFKDRLRQARSLEIIETQGFKAALAVY